MRLTQSEGSLHHALCATRRRSAHTWPKRVTSARPSTWSRLRHAPCRPDLRGRCWASGTRCWTSQQVGGGADLAPDLAARLLLALTLAPVARLAPVVPKEMLDKYGLQLGNAIMAEDKHMALYQARAGRQWADPGAPSLRRRSPPGRPPVPGAGRQVPSGVHRGRRDAERAPRGSVDAAVPGGRKLCGPSAASWTQPLKGHSPAVPAPTPPGRRRQGRVRQPAGEGGQQGRAAHLLPPGGRLPHRQVRGAGGGRRAQPGGVSGGGGAVQGACTGSLAALLRPLL